MLDRRMKDLVSLILKEAGRYITQMDRKQELAGRNRTKTN